MKQLLIIFIFLLMPCCLFGQHHFDKLIEAIAKVESNHNPKAVSKNGKYVGYLQISKVLVDDLNKKRGTTFWKYSDRLDADKSIAMFYEFQANHGNDSTRIREAINAWHYGPYSKKHGNDYYNKVMKYFKP